MSEKAARYMMIFTPNRQLQPGDLNLTVRDTQGLLFDPASIQFTIFQKLDGRDVLVYGPKATPQRASTGIFWVNLTIPTVWVGEFKLVWYLMDVIGSDEQSIYEDFNVVAMDIARTSHEAPSVAMARNPLLTPKTADMVMLVRELISDENPDRNYHFRPPTAGKTVAGYSQRVGFIWDDKTILRFLSLATDSLCTANPLVTYNYDLETLPPKWVKAVCVGAAGWCLSKEAARWTAEEFNYSLNGVSLDINKAQQYQGLAESYKAEFNEWKGTIAASKPVSVGLRQSRWLLG
jgi:hypothetical protein